MRLKDKIVVVTGASKGIGRAIALGTAREGADLVINFNSDAAGAEEVRQEILGLGRRAVTAKADISRVSEIRSLFDLVRREFARVDVLINNAGVTGWTSLFDTTEEKWDQVLDTNLKGTFFCSLEAAKMMRSGGGGAIRPGVHRRGRGGGPGQQGDRGIPLESPLRPGAGRAERIA